jgi:hypothetical protein
MFSVPAVISDSQCSYIHHTTIRGLRPAGKDGMRRKPRIGHMAACRSVWRLLSLLFLFSYA